MLLFIHGFNSAGNSDKARRLRSEFGQNTDVQTPTCPYEPVAAINLLSGLIENAMGQSKPVTICGSSLGGFYAVHLAAKYRLPSILINPLVDQTLLRHEIGPQQNYYTDETYEWTKEHCRQLDAMVVRVGKLQPKPLLLLDEKDELLDSRFAADHFADHADTHMFAGGSHRFEHMDEAIALIRRYLAI